MQPACCQIKESFRQGSVPNYPDCFFGYRGERDADAVGQMSQGPIAAASRPSPKNRHTLE
jgi:hypothetical protein